jgi:hypothetical protein
MEKSSSACVVLGAIAGAIATYAVLKNKDKIIEKFEELEEKVEGGLREKGITSEKAKEMLDKANSVAHTAIDKLSELLHGKNFPEFDKEHILAEIKALKEKIGHIGH